MHRVFQVLTAAMFFLAAGPASGQAPATPPVAPPPPPPPPADDSGLTVRDSSVGYIDSASPADQLRIRYDAGFDFRFPSRAEFFYPQGQPHGPGLPRPERRVDFSDSTLYLEKTLDPSFSVFAEGGMRYLNPDVNANACGWGDINLGFKYAFIAHESATATFQLRGYLPTGDTDRGLGTGHVSLEPALLGFARLTEDIGLAAELRYWQPIGGTDFAGGVLRYGLGVRYDVWESSGCRLAPIAEAVGWCVLGGRESQTFPSGMTQVSDASGTNIINFKLGARLDLGDRVGLYAGYGWALTGDRWYSDIVRVELRWLY